MDVVYDGNIMPTHFKAELDKLKKNSGEGGTADLTEVNDAITNLTSKVTALESYHAEVTGIEQLKSGFKFRHCQTVDSDAMIFIPKLYVKNESENGLIKR